MSLTCLHSSAASACLNKVTSQKPLCQAGCSSGPRGGRVSRESVADGAAATQTRTSAAGAPGRNASPPHAASPGFVVLTAEGLSGGRAVALKEGIGKKKIQSETTGGDDFGNKEASGKLLLGYLKDSAAC